MSITDELRECIRTANRSYEDTRNPFNDREILHIAEEELLGIADRIDEQHAVKVERLEKYRAAVDAMLKEYVKLPVDADGVPIRVGDGLTNGSDLPAKVRCMVLDEIGWMASTRELRGYGVPPATLRHVKPDSWVRIIGDAMSFEGDGWYSTRDDAMAELVERCRRLAGDAG